MSEGNGSRKKSKRPAASLNEAAQSGGDSLEGYAAMNAQPDDEIARLAYEYYEERGGEGGSAEEDWLRAEEEIRRRRGKTSGSGA